MLPQKEHYWTTVCETASRRSAPRDTRHAHRAGFFLRRLLGDEYLDLLRFYLNHHRFMRSDRPERTGKSLAELLSGEEHRHWLELLGFEMFHRN